jgi:hypothetical protein
VPRQDKCNLVAGTTYVPLITSISITFDAHLVRSHAAESYNGQILTFWLMESEFHLGLNSVRLFYKNANDKC